MILRSPEEYLEELDNYLQSSTVRLEYVENFDLSVFPKQPNDFGDMLDEMCFDSYIKQLNDGVDVEEIPILPRFYERRYFIEDFLQNGVLHPLNAETYKTEIKQSDNDNVFNDKNGNNVVFLIHPGQKRLHVAQLLNWKSLSFFIYSPKSENITFGGTEIKSVKDFTDLDLYKTYQKENIDWGFRYEGWTKFFNNNIKGMGTETKLNLCYTGYGKQKSREEYILDVYKFEDRKKYIDLLKNSLPLKVFKDISTNDIYTIPKKLGFNGMAVYINPKLNWNRDIDELLYFGKVDKPMCKNSDDSVILFNCEHKFWKTNNDISKLKIQEVGFLPLYSV